eukprot:CAMPEP_0115473386 /NCGR_PEP_ID=MMETSP0271-20121206/53540_1 /TAXON_ID=71861 /ORGANISM="Scrippsiella trochoidea, Strain CCMP3099" /LENGTH=57 /DNA_ID=CAMNT_0002900657 /DNA_START=69 /DNA_END=242 /DNA_ORIENTATION=-
MTVGSSALAKTPIKDSTLCRCCEPSTPSSWSKRASSMGTDGGCMSAVDKKASDETHP